MANARMTKKPVSKVTNENAGEEQSVASTVTTDFASTVKPSAPKVVRVRVAKNHDCCIGGKYYHFEGGKVYDVPLGVKNVLRKGDLLRPLG